MNNRIFLAAVGAGALFLWSPNYAQEISVELKSVARAVPEAKDIIASKYARLVLQVQGTPAVPEEKRKFLQALGEKAKDLLAPSTITTIATVAASRGDMTVPPQKAYSSARQGDQAASEDLSDGDPITTYTRLSDGVDFHIRANIASDDKVDTAIVSGVLSVLKTAKDLVANPTKLLSALTKPQFDESAKAIDKSLSAFFSAARTKSNSHTLNALNDERIDILVKPINQPNALNLISVVIQTVDSILSADGSKALYPRPEEIKGRRVGPKPSDTVESVLEQEPSLLKLLASGKSDDLQRFCLAAPVRLATAGLNGSDSAAVMATYLRSTTWNTKYAVRPSPDTDNCSVTVAGITETNLNGVIKDKDALGREGSAARKDAITKLLDENKGLWNLIPKALQEKKSDTWANLIFADQVDISVDKTPLTLTDTFTLSPGKSRDLDGDEVARIFARSSLAYSRRDPDLSCFRFYPNSTFTTFYSEDCIQIKNGNTNQLDYVKVDFTIDENRRVTAIKFLM